MHYALTREVAQAILNYLAKQPYEDVFQLINGLQNSQRVELNKQSSNNMQEDQTPEVDTPVEAPVDTPVEVPEAPVEEVPEAVEAV